MPCHAPPPPIAVGFSALSCIAVDKIAMSGSGNRRCASLMIAAATSRGPEFDVRPPNAGSDNPDRCRVADALGSLSPLCASLSRPDNRARPGIAPNPPMPPPVSHAEPAAPAEVSGQIHIAVNTANLSLVVGAAVTLEELSRHRTEHGVSREAIPHAGTTPHGGRAHRTATGAGRAAVGHALLGLQVVSPDGEAPARFGGESMKDVAGYDTKRLSIGGHAGFGAISIAVFKISVDRPGEAT